MAPVWDSLHPPLLSNTPITLPHEILFILAGLTQLEFFLGKNDSGTARHRAPLLFHENPSFELPVLTTKLCTESLQFPTPGSSLGLVDGTYPPAGEDWDPAFQASLCLAQAGPTKAGAVLLALQQVHNHRERDEQQGFQAI